MSRIFPHLILALILAFPALCLAGDDTLCITSDRQFSYAQSLFDQKEYETCQVELSRFIEFFPNDERIHQARYTIGVCRLEALDLTGAKKIFDNLMNDNDSGTWGIEAYFMMARYHKLTGNPVLGEICLKNLIALTHDQAVKDRAYNAIAWLRLETAQWDQAKAHLSLISDSNKDTYHVPRILSELDKTRQIPKKNPALAGALSIVPGTGYLYCGRYRDALVSFLLNGGFILAAYDAFDHDHHALGGVITFVGFGFYAGNIYGSASSAHKYNMAANRAFISHLKNNVLPSASLGLLPKAGSLPELAVRFRF